MSGRDDAGGCAEELPVGAALIARLRRWQGWYDRESWDPTREGTLDIAAFAAEGLAIARAVKAALPGWTVVYLDEAAVKAKPDGPREAFEYEIA